MVDVAKRAVIYARISKTDEKFDKVAEQEALCRELAEQEGYEVVGVYSDDGVSGAAGKVRKGWSRLLADTPKGEFDVILARAMDRLTRDPQDAMTLNGLCAKAEVVLHTKFEGKSDPREAVAELTAFVRGWLGKQEVKATKQRVDDRREKKRKLGRPGPGPRPFGYTKWDPKHPDVQDLVPDEAALIKLGTEMVLSGAPRYQVTKAFNESGIKTVKGVDWHSAKVGALLTRWRNAGWVELNNEPDAQAIWPAIVSLEDVRNVRLILSRGRAPGQWKKPTMLASGLARCRCGYQLVATGSTVGPSYRCGELIAKPDESNRSPGPHVTIAAKLLDPMVREAVVDAYFKRPASSGGGDAEAATLGRIYDQQTNLRAELERAERGFIGGYVKEATLKGESARINAQLVALETQASALVASSAHAAMLSASMNALTVGLDLDAPRDPNRFEFRKSIALSSLRGGKTRAQALDSAASAEWWELDDAGEPVFRVDPSVWDAVARRFDSLPLSDQRRLVQSLITIKVNPGQGKSRVAIDPA